MTPADHPLVRMLSGFEGRVSDLSRALAQSGVLPGRPLPAPPHEREWDERDARALAIATAAAKRIWFATAVPLDAFLQPGNRVAILEPPALRRVLAARALFRCRDSVRRCIDREQRRALTLAVGKQALARLEDRTCPGAFDEPLPSALSADALAHLGWRSIAQDGACGNATLVTIVRLSLAQLAGDEAWRQACAAAIDEPVRTHARAADGARSSSRSGSDGVNVNVDVDVDVKVNASLSDTSRFFSIAGDLFPELQWLFG